MSAQQGWNLQTAIYDRLVAQLAGQGPGGADVEVFDEVPANPERLHVRIEGTGAFPRLVKCHNTRHVFEIKVYDRPTTETNAARGQKTAKVLSQKVIAALIGWNPAVTGASAIRYEGGPFAVDEPNGLTSGFTNRFAVLISES